LATAGSYKMLKKAVYSKAKFFLIICSLLPHFTAWANKACILSTGLNIQTQKHNLFICENSTIINKFKISIGKSGAGKTLAGDKKTPLGVYTLESPRISNRFGIFIPIQYPTIEQKQSGYTGNDVGIHGPFRLFTWAGSMNTWIDWTKGCVAVSTNSEIETIANWVKKHPSAQVIINEN
jgi:hypothetical protein